MGGDPGATLALFGRPVASVPHEVVGVQLATALESIEQGHRSIWPDQRQVGVDLDHWQAPPGRSDRIALPSVRLVPSPELVELGLEGGPIHGLGQARCFVSVEPPRAVGPSLTRSPRGPGDLLVEVVASTSRPPHRSISVQTPPSTGPATILSRVTDPFSKERIRAAYDAVADDYDAVFGNDLAKLPLDRRMLDQAKSAANGGLILDLGCGTGSAGSYLSSRGARVVGLDLSPGMLRHCTFPVCRGDIRALPFGDSSFAAVVAYYTIQHVTRPELVGVLLEAARVLTREGALLLSAHLGEGEVLMEEFLGRNIATTGGTLFSLGEVSDRISSTGFLIETCETRDPLRHEYQSRRIYVLAKRAS